MDIFFLGYQTSLPQTLPSEEHERVLPEGQLPVLLWWYKEAYTQNTAEKTHTIQCSSGACITSIDRALRNDPSIRAFVFYGTSFLANDLPLPRQPFHLWALLHEESPKNNWIFSHDEGIR